METKTYIELLKWLSSWKSILDFKDLS